MILFLLLCGSVAIIPLMVLGALADRNASKKTR